MTIQLNEDFASERGQWANYDAYDPAVRNTLRKQKHIDIRSGIADDVVAPPSVLELSRRTMGVMTGVPASAFDVSSKVIKRGEHWNRGVTSSSSGHDYRPVLTTPLMTGTTSIESVIAVPGSPVGTQKRNYVTNPSFELGTSNWAPFTTGGVVPTLVKNTAWSKRGGAAGLLSTAVHPDNAHESGLTNITVFNVLPNTSYYGASTIRTVSLPVGGTIRFRIYWYSTLSTLISTVTSTGVSSGINTNSLLAVSPATAVYARIAIITKDYTGAAASFDVDEVYFVEGASPQPYFDGYMPGYYWTGAPHNSPSEGLVEFEAETVDLLTDFEDDDSISVVFPDFPSSQITLTSSWMDLTSNPNGDFSAGPTASVRLDANLETWGAGNRQFRVLRSTFQQNSIDLSKVTGVRFRITSTADFVQFKIGAIRLLSKDWKYASVDINTRYGELRRPWSRDGTPTAAIDFDQPIVWRAAEVPGQSDPKPIDFNLAVAFNTGSRQGSNNISMYGRELTEDFLQQLDINSLTMADLNGHDQPDLGQAMYNSRVQTDLEPFKQDQLKGLEQFDLERTPDYLSASWIQFVVQWTATTTQVSIVNTEGNGYNFNLGTPLTANTNYVLVFELEDTSARAAIYPLGDRGQIIFNAPVFDSTVINDDFSYKRRKGRFGWFANLADGDAYVESIRFRSASYAEYRSLPYESLTPVIGAELFAESSPVIDLFEFFAPTESSVNVESDREVSASGESFRVTDYGDFTHQGIQSNEFDITDFDQTEILLDVYYPSAFDQDATLEFYLKNQADYLIALPRPKIYPDQWQTIRLRAPSSHLAQTGLYRLVVVQNNPANLNWWIDNVRVFERTVSWHGRAFVEDPWAATEDDWTPFQNALNRDYGGILFQSRERRLQIKGVGHKQDSQVSKVQFKPRYAELGRFVWPEDAVANLGPPVASYSTSNVGRTYTFDGFGSTDPDGQIINWYWTVSDGTVYVGPIIQHTFGQAGTYTVTLTVTDPNGLVNTTSAIHSVV